MPEKINPYIAGAPVVESRMFFGREDVFSWIERSLSGQFVNHILVIHGQRRVGKTSVLKHLGKRLPKSFIPIFIDLQGRVNTTLPRFLWWLAREITRALDLPDPQRDIFESDPEFFESGFLPQVEAQLGERVLLLTFDEFDTLESTTAQEGLALPFMAMLKHLMEHDKLNFIFSIGSSGRKLENMQAAYTSFFKQALYRKISFLGEGDARDLITKPVEGILAFDLDAVDAIFEITSGHPYFIQLICHELFSVCQKTDRWQVSKPDVDAVLDAVIERGTVNLKFVWDEASELEKWVLAALAQFEKGASLEELDKYLKKHKVRFIRQDLESAVLHLREKDVLSSGNRFVIYLMQLWLVQNRSIEQVREELEKVNPIVSRLLQVGHEYLEQGEHQKAIESFQEALQAEEDNYEVRMGLAAACMAREDFGRASAEYEEILSLYPEDVAAQTGCCDAYLALGDFRLAMGRLDEAEYAFQQVLRISPRHTEGSRRMAKLCHHRAVLSISGAQEAALEQVHMALEYTPRDTDLQASVQDLEALAAGQKDIQQVLGDWGQRASRSRNWQDAAQLLEAYQRALGKQQPDESLLSALAQVRQQARQEQLDSLRKQAERMQRLEQYDEAIYALEKYLELQPGDAEQVPDRIKSLKEARKQAQLRESRAEAKPFWQRPLLWAGAALAAALIILLALPNSPLRPQMAAGPTLTPQTIIEERVVVATPVPTTAPTPTPEPLPYKWTKVTSLQMLFRDSVELVAIHPHDADIMYAGTKSSGVYKTNDGGVSWQPVGKGLTGHIARQIIIDPQQPETVYASTKVAGVFKSQDGGASWRRLETNCLYADIWWGESWGPPHLTMHPADSSHLLYTSGASISESRDHGETWTRLEIPFSDPGLAAIDPQSGNLIAVSGVVWGVGPVRVYLSDGLRTKWELVHEATPLNGITFNFLKYDPVRSRFFLDINNWEGLQSSDGGNNWESSDGDGLDFEYWIAPSNPNRHVKLSPKNQQSISGHHTISVSSDGGISWYERVNGLGTVETIFEFDPDQPLIYIGQYTRIERWDRTDYSQHPIIGFGNYFAYDLADNSFQQVSKDLCVTYPVEVEQENCIHRHEARDIHNPEIIYQVWEDGVYMSSDNGATWDAINDGLMATRVVYDLAFDPNNPDDLYALTPFGIYKLEKQ